MSAAGAAAAAPGGTGLPFQIRVLEGRMASALLQTGQPNGIIQLVGRSSPFRPIKFGGTQRHQTTFYPGNPNGSQLVIGSTRKPTTVTGEWNDKYVGQGQSFALALLLDSIMEAGLSVEVTWPMSAMTGDPSSPTLTGNPNVRVGIISNFDYTILYGIEDIGWECEFTWRSQGQTTAPPISSTGMLNPREGFNDVTLDLGLTQAMVQSFTDSPQVNPVGLPQVLDQQIDDAMEQINSAVAAVATATAAVTTATQIPESAAQQLITSAQTGVQACLNLEAAVLGINPLTLEVQDSPMDLLRLVDSIFDVLAQCDAASETCIDAANGVLANIQPDVIAMVRAPAGTDLRDLAIKYYGDPDSWWAIANANDITGSAVPAAPTGPSDNPNRMLVIPRLQPGTASQLEVQC